MTWGFGFSHYFFPIWENDGQLLLFTPFTVTHDFCMQIRYAKQESSLESYSYVA